LIVNPTDLFIYRNHADRYVEISKAGLQSTYEWTSDPAFKSDEDKISWLESLLTKDHVGLDAGCGPAARDVAYFLRKGYSIYGIDAVEESLDSAISTHGSAIADLLSVHDLHLPLLFPDESFDFVICNAVIQHLNGETVYGLVLPEFRRVLKKDGILMLAFKTGNGNTTVWDPHFESERTFYLYPPAEVEQKLEELGFQRERSVPGNGSFDYEDGKGVECRTLYLRKAF
jgi:ubiquinone/menaquinone biosynthesis C-methylase UbiE